VTRPGRRRGVIFLVVLVTLIAVVAITLSLAREVRVEVGVADAAADDVKLRALVASAVERARAEVRLDELPGDTLGDDWRDSEALFRGQELGDGRWWLLVSEPDPGDGREVRYGVRDLNGLLNVNVATRDQLLALPGVTEEAVDSLLDWRDDDDDPNEFGAESVYYAALEPAYLAKNAPIESLEELLLVRGIDARMLYGEDRNRNGLIDPGEDDGDGSFPPDDADGELDRGLVDYLTVYSQELNRTADGRERLLVGEAGPDEVDARLEEAGVSEAGRQAVLLQLGGGGGGPGGGGGGGQATTLGQLIASPAVGQEDAALVLDELAVVDAEVLPGRINVNTAPREVLLGLPGLEEPDVDAVMAARLDFSQDLSSPAWLLGAIEREKLVLIADLVTTRATQFAVDAVALIETGSGGARFRRVEALIDRAYAPVRILGWRDVSGRGFPFPGERGEELP